MHSILRPRHALYPEAEARTLSWGRGTQAHELLVPWAAGAMSCYWVTCWCHELLLSELLVLWAAGAVSCWRCELLALWAAGAVSCWRC